MFVIAVMSTILRGHHEQFIIGVTSSLAATFIFAMLLYEWHIVGHFIGEPHEKDYLE